MSKAKKYKAAAKTSIALAVLCAAYGFYAYARVVNCNKDDRLFNVMDSEFNVIGQMYASLLLKGAGLDAATANFVSRLNDMLVAASGNRISGMVVGNIPKKQFDYIGSFTPQSDCSSQDFYSSLTGESAQQMKSAFIGAGGLASSEELSVASVAVMVTGLVAGTAGLALFVLAACCSCAKAKDIERNAHRNIAGHQEPGKPEYTTVLVQPAR